MSHRSEPTGDHSARSVALAAARVLPAVDRAIADLAEAAELVPFLALLRDPSTRRPWREAVLDAARRADLSDLATHRRRGLTGPLEPIEATEESR